MLLKMSTKGSKAELFARLEKALEDIRGNAPEDCEESDEAELVEQDEEDGVELEDRVETHMRLRTEIAKAEKILEGLNQQIGNIHNSSEVNGSQNSRRDNSDNRNFRNGAREDGSCGGREDGSGEGRDGSSGEGIFGGRDGGRGEGRDGGRDEGSGEGRGGGREGGRDGDGKITWQQNNGQTELGNFSSPGFNMAMEMLMDFGDKVSVRSWIDQWKSISTLYNLSARQRLI